MHIQAERFLSYVSNLLPDYFANKIVLDVGSGDINGNNRALFKNCDYTGNDVVQAPNVTIVSRTKDLPFEDERFDTIVSSECFEHDPEYKQSILKIYHMLKPNGLFFFTCASTNRPEHGTRRTSAHDCYGTMYNIADFPDYYYNLTVEDANAALDLNNSFVYWKSYYNSYSKDLYFVGIKKSLTNSNQDFSNLVDYKDEGVVQTTNSILSH
jgi:SAM-dependent methyltransferase